MKQILIFLCFFALTFSGFSSDGFQATYSVKVESGPSYEYKEVITVCGDLMRIRISTNQYFILDKKKGLAWKVNIRAHDAVAYTFNDNQPFYQQFLLAYGLMGEKGQLIFPQVVFKRTGNRKVVRGVPCFEAKLPGEFMNSTTTAWMAEKAVKTGGEQYSHFMSFFTKNADFLDLIRHATGFPRLIVSKVRLNGSVTVNRQTLLNIKKMECQSKNFSIPKGFNIRKAVPSGMPLRRF